MCKICQTKHWSRDGHALSVVRQAVKPEGMKPLAASVRRQPEIKGKNVAKKPKRKVGR